LQAFGNANSIGYPLLSDVGSKVIRSFGILNTNVPEDHKMMYGMPWPGDYLISPEGTVRDKLFLRDYQHRPSASQIVLGDFGADAAGNTVDFSTDWLSASITLSTDRCFPGQEIALSLKLKLKPGWHVYGKPLPDRYQATELTLEGPLVDYFALELPAARPMRLKGLGETLSVYDGEIRAVGKLGIKWSPPGPIKFLEAFGKWIEPGAYKIEGQLRFQACTDSVCDPPQAIKFELPLRLEAGIPAAPKKSN
jgi:Disulphide bond corrector protein DsbC/AhpC/TSA family